MNRKLLILIVKLIAVVILVLLIKIYLCGNPLTSTKLEEVLFFGLSSIFILSMIYLLATSNKNGNMQKPNVLFWIVILTMTGGALALVYLLVLILTSQGPIFARANIGNIVGLITSILLLLSGYLHIRNHRSDLFGLPGEGGND